MTSTVCTYTTPQDFRGNWNCGYVILVGMALSNTVINVNEPYLSFSSVFITNKSDLKLVLHLQVAGPANCPNSTLSKARPIIAEGITMILMRRISLLKGIVLTP